MIVKLLTEHHLEFLNLKGGCRGSSESTHVKMTNCWKSHVLAHKVLNGETRTRTLTHIESNNKQGNYHLRTNYSLSHLEGEREEGVNVFY